MSTPASSTPDPQRRGLLAVVGLLLCALAVGAIVVGKGLFSTPTPAKAGSVRDGAAAIEAGLEAAAVYQREKKYAEAATILEQLSEQAPMDKAVRVAYAQALIGQKKHDEAYKQYEAAIVLSGSPIKSQPPAVGDAKSSGLKRDPDLAQLHFEAATCASVAKIPGRAEEHYSMAQMLDPGEPRYPLFLAMVQIRNGDDTAAAASLLRAVKLNPDLAEAWGTMAELELKKNQPGLAAQHIATARKLQPEVSRWKVDEARIYNRQNEPEKAAAIISSLPQAERASKSVMAIAAESAGQMRQPATAASMYEAASKSQPADAEIALQAALWHDRAGNAPKAKEFAKHAAMLGNDEAKELLERLTASKAK